jgi:very-short-patch-repair endonuclease
MNEIEAMFYNAFTSKYPAVEIKTQYRIGKYTADFIVGRIAIEIDGKDYHETSEQVRSDKIRDREIALKGFNVIRYSGYEVYHKLQDVIIEVYKIVTASNKMQSRVESQDQLWLRKVVDCKLTRILPNRKETSGWKNENFYNFGMVVCDSLNKGYDVNIRRVK